MQRIRGVGDGRVNPLGLPELEQPRDVAGDGYPYSRVIHPDILAPDWSCSHPGVGWRTQPVHNPSVIKEIVRFELPLGSRTDEFVKLHREVTEAMLGLGLDPGVRWTTVSGRREVIMEREFSSLADYEAKEAAFHAGADFMSLWRRMEACADSMEVELLQNALDPAEIQSKRAGADQTTG